MTWFMFQEWTTNSQYLWVLAYLFCSSFKKLSLDLHKPSSFELFSHGYNSHLYSLGRMVFHENLCLLHKYKTRIKEIGFSPIIKSNWLKHLPVLITGTSHALTSKQWSWFYAVALPIFGRNHHLNSSHCIQNSLFFLWFLWFQVIFLTAS